MSAYDLFTTAHTRFRHASEMRAERVDPQLELAMLGAAGEQAMRAIHVASGQMLDGYAQEKFNGPYSSNAALADSLHLALDAPSLLGELAETMANDARREGFHAVPLDARELERTETASGQSLLIPYLQEMSDHVGEKAMLGAQRSLHVVATLVSLRAFDGRNGVEHADWDASIDRAVVLATGALKAVDHAAGARGFGDAEVERMVEHHAEHLAELVRAPEEFPPLAPSNPKGELQHQGALAERAGPSRV